MLITQQQVPLFLPLCVIRARVTLCKTVWESTTDILL